MRLPRVLKKYIACRRINVQEIPIMKKMKLSLKEKAIIGIIATLVPILITFVLVYCQNRVYLKNRVLDTLTVIAESYEGQVYQFMEKAKIRAQDFSSDGFIRTHLQRAIHGNTSAINKLNKDLVKHKLSLDKTINTINILSLEGRVVASTNNAEMGRDFSSEAIFLKGKEAVTMVDKCLGHCELTKIAVSAPILNKDTGRLIGVIVNYISMAGLDNIVTRKYAHDLGAVSWAKGQGAWKSLEIYLVNRDKRMITKSIFVKDAVCKQAVDTLPINEGLTSNKGITGFYRNYRGVEVTGASMYIPSMKWVLLVEIDKEEVLSPVKRILISALITAAVVIVMMVLLFIGFIKKMVTPLRKISEASKKIASGNFDVSVPVQTSDEIGALCESFNYMIRHVKGRTMELEKSNTRLAESQRIARIGNWEWDVIKDEVSWSYEAYRIFGLTQENFVSPFETFLNHVYPDDRGFVRKSIDDALNNKNPLEIDHRILLKDSNMRIVHERAAVISDNLGKVVRIVGTVQDITEHKRTEEEVSLLKTLTLAICEAKDLHDALVVTLEKVCSATGWIYGEAWVPDQEGKCLVRDHAFYSKVESLKRFSELSGTFTFPPSVGLPGRIWSLKQPVWVRDVTVDPNYLRAPIAKEVGLKAAIGFPVFSEKEMVAVLVFYVFDVHEKDEQLVSFVSSVVVQLGEVIKRKKAEESLRESEEKLRAILDNTPNVVYVKDIRNKYLFINKQFENLFHVKGEELQGKTDYDLWTKEMSDAFVANDRKVIEAGTPLEFEEVAPHDDGLHTYISVKFPLFDVNGTVYAVCGISTDITEHKHADDLLIERSRLATLGAEVGFALSQKDTLCDMLQKCSEAFVRNLNMAFARIWTINTEGNVLELQSSAGIYTHIDGPHRRVPVGMYKIGLIASERKPHLTNKAIGDPRIHNQEWAKQMGMVAFAGYPLMIEDRIVGVLAMFSTKPIPEFTFEALASVSDMIALGIERKRTQERLEKYGILFSEITDLAYIYDTKGNILFVNKVFEKLTGHKPESFFGKSFAPLFDEENQKKATDVYTRTLKGESPQYELYFKDTGILCEYKNIPLKDGKGNVIGVMGVARDITMRKQMENQLRKLSTAIEQSPSVIVITDISGKIQYVNQRFTQLTGYTLKEAIGKNPSILKSGKTPPEAYKQLWDAITTGSEWQGEFCNKKKNGEFYWELAHISSLKNHKGIITNFVAFKDDITERKRLEEEKDTIREQLFHAQKLESVGTLAGGVAHDFNNILTAIIGYGNLLQIELKEDGPARDFIQKILKSAERAANLTQGLLAFSRKQPRNPSPVYLNEIVKEAESLLTRVIREDIKLRTALTDKECVVMADVGQMEQVLMNLATNARDAMPNGGALEISSDIAEIDNEFIKTHGYGAIGRYALITVSDRGVGMDEKTRKQIFVPFFTTKVVGKGTGLGLAIVYGIIQQHGGYITVESEVSKGTTFRIYLPMVEQEFTGKKTEEAYSAPQGGTETILVAEDEEYVRHLVKMVLERHGYRVIEAVDGRDAIEKFKANKDKIHLLLFDVIMPNKNGKEAYEAIREVRHDVKALFMSGYSDEAIQRKDILGVGVTLVSKPISPVDILKKVREALDR